MKILLHEAWLREALRLAEKGRATTSPNPMVGACVVRAGVCVGRGYHRAYGEAHAEVNALRGAGKKASGATLYVTLEPCATWGKTPPCVEAIVRAGIREVVVGALDPNPKNHGRGIAALNREGVRVRSPVLANEVRKQNESFFKYVLKKLPFVTLKMAQSLDGKIATRRGLSRWISSRTSRDFVQGLRAEHDAILIGKNTLLRDNPRLAPLPLTRPLSPKGRGLPVGQAGKVEGGKPWRVVLDPEGQTGPRARVFKGDQLTLCVIPERRLLRRPYGPPRKDGNSVIASPRGAKQSWILLPVAEEKGRLNLKELLKKLASLGVAKLLVEGGGEVAWSLLRERLVDRVYWIVAPKIIGGRLAKTSVEGEGVEDPARAIRFRSLSCRPLGEDWLFEGTF